MTILNSMHYLPHNLKYLTVITSGWKKNDLFLDFKNYDDDLQLFKNKVNNKLNDIEIKYYF